MKRFITPYILKDLPKKIVFLTGPRQVGKTTLAKSLTDSYDYFNYDRAENRLALKSASWNRKKSLIIFDELHKMKSWKQCLKGIYDTEGTPPSLLVTGSVKLNAYRKVGDSLAGRHSLYRLHPLDMKETSKLYPKDEAWHRLWNCSGFPEPFLDNSVTNYHRWQRSHLDVILRYDLLDTQNIRDIQAMETLVEPLKNNVGSTISYHNLAQTIEKDSKTVKRWLQLLEDLFVIFKVTPYSKKIARSLLKEPKYYFYDCAAITKDAGTKLENLIAAALLKELHCLEDIYGATTKLHFIRTKDGKEIDFFIIINNQPYALIEVKYADDNPNKNFYSFNKYFPQIKKIQLVKEIAREKTYSDGLEIRDAVNWLINLDFSGALDYIH